MEHDKRVEFFEQVSLLSGKELYEFLDTIPNELKSDHIFALYTVGCVDPMSIKCFAEIIKSNKTIASSAVRNNGLALQYISEDLKKEKDIVISAVISNGMAIQYADEELKKDENIGLLAVANNRLAVVYVGKNIIQKLYDPKEERLFEDYAREKAIELLKQTGFPEILFEDETIGSFEKPFKDYDINVEEAGLSEDEVNVKRFKITKLANDKEKMFKKWYDEVIESKNTEKNHR